MTIYRIAATRQGDAKVLTFRLPSSMSRALPAGNHEFDIEFTETGLALTYVGPAPERRPVRGAREETPVWANGNSA